MEPATQFELPFQILYQCRICTHIIVDEVEKIFSHLEKRHSDMLENLDEIRDYVLQNGLGTGAFTSPLNIKQEEEVDEGGDEEEQPPILPHPRYVEQENGFGEHEMVLVPVENAYEYQNGEEGELDYNYDDEEQLPDNPELTLNVDYEEEGYENGYEYGEVHNMYGEYGQEEVEEDEGEEVKVYPAEQYNELDEAEDEQNGGFVDEGEEDYEEGEDVSLSSNGHNEEEDGGQPIKVVVKSGKTNSNLNGYGYTCKTCGKFFSSRRGVDVHQQNHHKNTPSTPSNVRHGERKLFTCKICRRRLPSFKNLKEHVKAHNPKAHVHICKFCCEIYNNTASLTKHLEIHRRENPNKCNVCGKTFVSGNTLKIHKKIHSGIKPFVCNYAQCGRAFNTKSTLESHIRTHTGEKPYKCSYCDSAFTTSSAMYRHLRHVHKVQDPSQIDLE